MSIIKLHSGIHTNLQKKKIEILKVEGKYYIELEEFQNNDCIVELCISLASENQSLRDNISILEEKIKVLQKRDSLFNKF